MLRQLMMLRQLTMLKQLMMLRQQTMQKQLMTLQMQIKEAADKVAALIDAIYVQERTDDTDEQCKRKLKKHGMPLQMLRKSL